MKNRLREDLCESQVLSSIDKGIQGNPSSLTTVPVEFWEKLKNLTKDVEVYLDAPITDGAKFDPFTQLEGLERTSMLISIINDRFGFVGFGVEGELEYDPEDLHPSLYDEYAKRLIATATECLCELYQHVGRWEILNKADKSVDKE